MATGRTFVGMEPSTDPTDLSLALADRLARAAAPPPPPGRDAASIRVRLDAGLRHAFGQRNPRRRHQLVELLFNFLTLETQVSTAPALRAQTGLSASGLNEVWRALRETGLVAVVQRQWNVRHYGLTAFGGAWLLAVSRGEPLPTA